MIVYLSTDQIRTVDEMRAFVEGTELADIGHLDRGGAYALISWPKFNRRGADFGLIGPPAGRNPLISLTLLPGK